MREEGDSSNTGSPVGGAHAPTGNPRGPAWAGGVAERLVVPEKLGNAGGGKEPQFESSARRKQGHGDWWKRLIAPEAFGHSRRRYMRKPFVGDGMISSREPGAGKPHARFDERGEETWLRWGLRHRLRAKAAGNSYSPHLRPGRASPRLYGLQCICLTVKNLADLKSASGTTFCCKPVSCTTLPPVS